MKQLIRILAMTCGIAMISGCSTLMKSPSDLWVEQNDSFMENVVMAELWPKYQTHPDVTPAGMANVGAAIAEHQAELDEMENGAMP